MNTPEDTAPITVADKGYEYPMWWEDLVNGDVVHDERGEVYQYISGGNRDARDSYLKVYKYEQGKWYGPCVIHRDMQGLVYLRGVNEWRPNDD